MPQKVTPATAQILANRVKSARSLGIYAIDVTVDVIDALLAERADLLKRLDSEGAQR